MPQSTNIINVHQHCKDKENVSAWIDRKIYRYFFRHVLAGDRGPRQAFICMFFQRFYEACVEAGIKEVYDENNEEKLVAVLERLNFKELK